MRILCVIGTRPEGIKMAILYKLLKAHSSFDVKLCNTGQHQELLDSVFTDFEIEPEFSRKANPENQSLINKHIQVIDFINKTIAEYKPELLMVQGDTLSAHAGAFCAFLNKVPIAHVEAGLRTYSLEAPFPEEGLRQCISSLARLHFAPGEQAYKNLVSEGYDDNTIYITGNTFIDALHYMKNIKKVSSDDNARIREFVEEAKSINSKLLILTMHRRESHGLIFNQLMDSLPGILRRNNWRLIYISHPHPEIQKSLESIKDCKEILIHKALRYPEFIRLIRKSDLVLTDSGGVQEETFHLGKPLIVLRKQTERNELMNFESNALIDDMQLESQIMDMLKKHIIQAFPYGDGGASQRIIDILEKYRNLKT